MTNNQDSKFHQKKMLLMFLTAAAAGYLLVAVFLYWYADGLYSKARGFNLSNKPDEARKILVKAVEISPNEPYFRVELATAYTKLGMARAADSEIQKAITLSPANVNIKRTAFTQYLNLALIDSKYLISAINILNEAVALAPTDAKLHYNLGLIMVRVKENKKAIEIMEKTILLKPNYKEPRLALAYLLAEKGEYEKARRELEYILEKIDPNDDKVKAALEEIR